MIIINNLLQVYEQMKSYLKLGANDHVVIGVSGGPDSMALLHLLLKYKEKISFQIVCAHVDHDVRKESASELLFVKEYCEKNNIIFESMKIETKIVGNFENEARKKRYDFFNNLIKKYKAKYLFTAHHGDDLMETILMRIVRGSNINGYSGFKEIVDLEDYTLVRPLISVTKEEIIEYNKWNDIKWVEDYTNKEDIHTRNRYRKYILPKLKEEDAKVNLKFLQYSKALQECNEYIEREVKKIIPLLYIAKVLDINKLKEQDIFIQKQIIYYMFKDYYKTNLELINNKHIEIVIQLINTKGNNKINLPNNIVGIKSYDKFYFSELPLTLSYNIKFKGREKLPNGFVIEQVETIDDNSNFTCRLSSKDIKLPLYIRTKENGDFMYVKNLNGRKKIKDIFISEKIEPIKRKDWPIVVDSNNNIVWLPGIKKSKYDKQKDEKCDIILRYY